MKAFVLVIASIFFAPVVLAQTGDEYPAEKIKILSWNIYMLPGIWSHGNTVRATAIGELLSAGEYDVVVFQEAFSKKARKVISRLLQPAFPFQYGPENTESFSLKINSGLWIISRYPIVDAHSIVFDTRHGIDALARKGGLMVTLNVKGQMIQIAGTHLQNEGPAWRRSQQCTELYERLLRKHEIDGVPQIICGDFNINMHDPFDSYEEMLLAIDAKNGPLTGQLRYSYDHKSNDMQSGKQNGQNLIDYILLRSNQSTAVCNSRKIITLQKSWRNHRDLSDHYSLEAEVMVPEYLQSVTASFALEDH